MAGAAARAESGSGSGLGSGVDVEVRGLLDPATVAEVDALVAAAADADGVRPLSEHVALHLRHGGESPARNILARSGTGTLLGYAHLDVTDPVEGPSAEVVVHPAHRRHGVGRALVGAAAGAAAGQRLRLWAHGERPGAAALARSMGFRAMRALWQMRRPLRAGLPAPVLPEGVTVRAFRPGQDEQAWLALNARAFAAHPEQGAWTPTDLALRMAEPWFDPGGFFLAERAGRLVGFHWTKVHGDHRDGSHGHGHAHDPIGEVYVLGVDPSEQGSGLGGALSLVGLNHLRDLGLAEVMLYVEADNAAAIGLYTRLGFSRWDTDLMFRAG